MSNAPMLQDQLNRYPFEVYCDGIKDNDSLLQRLGGVVASEIALGAPAFAAIALDKAVIDPKLMDEAQRKPMPNVYITPEDITAVKTQRIQAGLDPLEIYELGEVTRRLKALRIQQRHNLGIATCTLALDVVRSGLYSRITLAPQDPERNYMQPKPAIWPLLRQSNSNTRFLDYIAADARYRASSLKNTDNHFVLKIKTRSRLLVATTAYVVKESAG